MTEEKKRRYGAVTIRLSPKDIKSILRNPTSSRYGDGIDGKLWKAVVAKFPNIIEENAEEIKVGKIFCEWMDSQEYHDLKSLFEEKESDVRSRQKLLADEKAKTFQENLQARFTEAGIVNFVASFYGYVSLETLKRQEQEEARWKKIDEERTNGGEMKS